MKKNLFLAIAAAAIASSSFAQTTELSKWSVGIKGGVSTNKGISYSSDGFDRAYNPAAGIFVERTINPFYGLGLDYTYQGNDAKGNLYPLALGAVDFTSTIHQITAFSSINLSNILSKYRSVSAQRFNTYFNFGLGAGVGNYKDNTTGEKKSGLMSLSSSFGVNFAYTISKSLELGLEGKYQWNSNGEFSPTLEAQKDFYVADLNLRYKFNGVNNTRNINLTDFEKMNSRRESSQEAIDRLQYELARQAEEIKKLQARSGSDSIDGVAVKDIIMGQQYQIEQLTKQLTKTRKDLYKHLNDSGAGLTGDSAQYDISSFGFHTGSDKLTPSAYSVLDTLTTQLQKNILWTVKISGHTDNVGQEATNEKLSLKRADAVKKYFVKKGIVPARITAKGFASTKPVACNDNEEGRAKNRRVEIIVNK